MTVSEPSRKASVSNDAIEKEKTRLLGLFKADRRSSEVSVQQCTTSLKRIVFFPDVFCLWVMVFVWDGFFGGIVLLVVFFFPSKE